MRKSYAGFAKVLKMTSTFFMELCHGPGVDVIQILWNSIGSNVISFESFGPDSLCSFESLGCFGIRGASFGFPVILMDSKMLFDSQRIYQEYSSKLHPSLMTFFTNALIRAPGLVCET